jgi:hypothetical protein
LALLLPLHGIVALWASWAALRVRGLSRFALSHGWWLLGTMLLTAITYWIVDLLQGNVSLQGWFCFLYAQGMSIFMTLAVLRLLGFRLERAVDRNGS